MKQSVRLVLFTLTIITFISCGLGSSPKKSAQKFLTAFNDRDFDEARKYATPETIKLVDLMENLTNMAQSTDTVQRGKIEVFDEKIDGDTATVTFKEEGNEETQEIKLKKVDGEWLVHITKEDVAAKDITDGQTSEEEGFWSDDDSTEVDSTEVYTN